MSLFFAAGACAYVVRRCWQGAMGVARSDKPMWLAGAWAMAAAGWALTAIDMLALWLTQQ